MKVGGEVTLYANKKICVYSEISLLKTVLLHRPGEEIENVIPRHLERLLFDDIPFLKAAREEHDSFARVLREYGVEVLYLENLMSNILKDPENREMFFDDIIAEGTNIDTDTSTLLRNFLRLLPEKDAVDKIAAGVRKRELGLTEDSEEYPFILDPMPNLYFTRDPFASVGRGVVLSSMKKPIRRRESVFAKYIFRYHPYFKDSNTPFWYNRESAYNIEGGDLLILNQDILVIGQGERTDREAIECVALNIFEQEETFKTVLLVKIPKSRAFMHLDTVLTMVDYDKFAVYRKVGDLLQIYAISYDVKNKSISIKEESGSLAGILSKYLKVDVTLIYCGGGDSIVSEREQWNDAANTLAISPGKVITYERNYVTNESLDKHNISVITIPSGELSRGRGGPRCMSMPLCRSGE